jgi:hypothetical protein
MGEPGQHRRRGEQRNARMPADHLDYVGDIEMRQHDLMRALQHERQRIEPGAMRYRSRQQMGVALVDPLDIGVIALAHEEEVAVAQHGALRPAGRARGVEQPGAMVGGARLGQDRLGGEQRSVFGGPGRDHRMKRVDRAGEWCQRLGEARGGDEERGARVPGDVFDLARMQPCIGRHRAQPRRPAAEQELEEFAAIFEAQQHPVAGPEPQPPQPAGKARDPPGKLAVIPRMPPVAHRRKLRQPARHIEHQRREVHRPIGSWIGALRPSRQPLRGFFRMRIFLNAITT